MILKIINDYKQEYLLVLSKKLGLHLLNSSINFSDIDYGILFVTDRIHRINDIDVKCLKNGIFEHLIDTQPTMYQYPIIKSSYIFIIHLEDLLLKKQVNIWH